MLINLTLDVNTIEFDAVSLKYTYTSIYDKDIMIIIFIFF